MYKPKHDTIPAWQPINEYVLVVPCIIPEMSKGGIIIAAGKRPTSNPITSHPIGKVLKTGDGEILGNGTRGAVDVKTGDLVLLFSTAGHFVTIEENDYYIVTIYDIIMKLPENKNAEYQA